VPFIYLVIAVILWIAALAGWFAAFRYFRGRSGDLSPKDKVVGFMLAGPFFPSLHSSLAPRGYRLTTREVVGLSTVCAVVLAIVIGSLMTAYLADYRRAKDFCDQIRVGSSLADANRIATKDQSISGVYRREEMGQLRVLFAKTHSCQCDLGFKGDAITSARAWCTD
jgi:hypothetical protein